MGVCRFFQQGSCRFGTKCHNEHFDVKQFLKSDMESCINSNMWRFSVYGPFKDKPSIPNFIEDQSFEEVRFQAYESRRLNCFDQFHQQYTKEVHDTVNKMKAMLQMTPQIIDMMIKVYEAPDGNSSNTVNANQNANPFASQGGSIFSKPALGASGGNIFGTQAAATPAFGAAPAATPAFGAPAATPGFGAAPAPNSIFGGGGSSANNAAGSIFGGATNTNLFTQQQPQAAPAFGQQQPTNAFGQPQPQASIFSQPQQPQQQQLQQPQQQNLFVQPTAPSVFRGNMFTQAQPQPANPSPFGQSNPFQSQQMGGMFGGAAAATNTPNMFTQQQQQQQQQQQPQQQPPTGFFGQAAAATPFTQQLQPDAQQQLQFQQQQQQQQNNNNVSSIYSRMEDLTPEEIAAFKAEQFAPGQVPLKPPPRELC